MKKMFRPDSGLMRFLARVCDLICLNLIFSFLCITVVLSGTAITALYSVTLKIVRQEEDGIVKSLFQGVRDNFISSFPATLLLFTDVTLIAVLRYALYAERLLFSPVIFVLLAIIAVFLTALLSYLFPLTARFENTFPRHLGNSVRLAVANLPITFFLTTVNLMPFLFVAIFPNTYGYQAAFWLLIGIAAGAYLNSFYLRKVFDVFACD